MHRAMRVALFVSPVVVVAGAAACLFGGESASTRTARPASTAKGGSLQGASSMKPPSKVLAAAARVHLAPAASSSRETVAALGATTAKPATEVAVEKGATAPVRHHYKSREEAIKAIKEDPEKLAAEIRKVREGLKSPDAKARLAALREARDLRSPELLADVELIASDERSAPVRRVAAQVLAQTDPQSCEPLLRQLKKDGDVMVRVNASFGLARIGDEHEQIWLVQMCEASRRTAPELLPVLSNALEDPSLRSPAVIARFQQVANNPKVSQATRDRAIQVLKSKQS